MDDNDRIDPAADTGSFRRFTEREEPERSVQAFRLLTLFGAVLLFAGLVRLLLF